MRWLGPLIELAKSIIPGSPPSEVQDRVTEANIIQQVDNICKSKPIETAWATPNAKKVTVHGWVYDLAKGRIREIYVRDSPLQ